VLLGPPAGLGGNFLPNRERGKGGGGKRRYDMGEEGNCP